MEFIFCWDLQIDGFCFLFAFKKMMFDSLIALEFIMFFSAIESTHLIIWTRLHQMKLEGA